MSMEENHQVCVDPNGCSTRPHIRILFPVRGSQLHMPECRIRYVVENAPSGAFTRVFVGGTELEFFRNGKISKPYTSPHFDEAFTVIPGYWDVQVDSKSFEPQRRFV